MGCGQSSSLDDQVVHNHGNGKDNGSSAGSNSSPNEGYYSYGGSSRIPRVEACSKSMTFEFGNATIQYAYLSQRGFYPDDQNKLNQDAFSVVEDFSGVRGDGHFAVYDGHGRDGHKCAQFAKENMPAQIERYVQLARAQHKDTSLPVQVYERACTKAHLACNQAMHESSQVDDNLSGTTAISICFHDKSKMTICNVGDSRAIVGQSLRTNGNRRGDNYPLDALPLSRDQTPYRKDERIRVLQHGGRILSLDQMEGLEPISDDWDDLNLGEEIDEGGDPPRVWSQHGEYPGTAFTRSLGDLTAEELGVFAEPEILTRDVMSQDKIIVIASDGVFEFLTNQSVIDMCNKFRDPLQACKAVVAEAYELWLQYELRTDDITMICMFVNAVDTPSPLKVKNDASELGGMNEGNKPIRSAPSRELSKRFPKQQLANDNDVDEDFNINDLITEKSQEEKDSISEAIKTSVIFQTITDRQRDLIFGVMESIRVRKGEWIIKQGEHGDRFYVVERGRFEVRILNEGAEDIDGTGGNLVHIYEGDGNSHPTFGELALMYSAPRAASIIAQTDGKLWALHRAVFKKIQAEKSNRQELNKTVRKVLTRRVYELSLQKR